jgi:Putative zinc-finger
MNCTTVTELLPWWLNGTLGADERRAVEEHLAACESCRRELDETRAAAAVYRAHPPPEALVEHAAGRPAPGPTSALIEEHLSFCPTCAEEMALLRESHAAAAAADEKAEEKPGATVLKGPWAARQWRRLALAASVTGLVAAGGWGWTALQSGTGAADFAVRLAEAEDSARQLAAENERLRQGKENVARQAGDLDAQVAAANRTAAELEEKLTAERQRVAELEHRGSSLQMGLPVEALGLAETVYRDGENIFNPTSATDEGIPTLSRKAGFAVLSLELPARMGKVESVRLEVLDADGHAVLSERGPPPQSDLSYTVGFPTGKLDPGPYTLRLSTEEAGGGSEPLGTYRIRIE